LKAKVKVNVYKMRVYASDILILHSIVLFNYTHKIS